MLTFKKLVIKREHIGFKFGEFCFTRSYSKKKKKMGQKSNTLTLRKSYIETNVSSITSSLLLNSLRFLTYLNYIFNKRGVSIMAETLNVVNNQLVIRLELFYKSFKVSSYKSKIKHQSQERLTFKKYLKFVKLFSLFKKSSQTLVKVSTKTLNKNINSKLIILLFSRTKKFIGNIFSRRFNLYLDFLKLSNLYMLNFISTKQYLILIAQVFKFVPKKAHSKFIAFLKTLFQFFIIESKKYSKSVSTISSKSILGIKFTINGKLQGKARATGSFLQEGSIPIQTLSANIEYFQVTTFTLLGTFGLKMWVYRA